MPRTISKGLALGRLKISEALQADLRALAPEFYAEVMEEAIKRMDEHIRRLTKALQSLVFTIKMEAQAQGIVLIDSFVSCGRPTCLTCLGKHGLHYPYISREIKQPVYENLTEVRSERRRKMVRMRELKDFLKSIGVEEGKINYLFDLIDTRHDYLKTRNALIRMLQKAGVFEV